MCSVILSSTISHLLRVLCETQVVHLFAQQPINISTQPIYLVRVLCEKVTQVDHLFAQRHAFRVQRFRRISSGGAGRGSEREEEEEREEGEENKRVSDEQRQEETDRIGEQRSQQQRHNGTWRYVQEVHS